MKTTVTRVLVLATVFTLGMALEHVRAQNSAPLRDATVWHFGFAVKDVDKTLKAWDAVLQAEHTPVHEIKGLRFPASSKADRNVVIRTSEIKLNPGVELHLLQAVGGANQWADQIQKYGD